MTLFGNITQTVTTTSKMTEGKAKNSIIKIKGLIFYTENI